MRVRSMLSFNCGGSCAGRLLFTPGDSCGSETTAAREASGKVRLEAVLWETGPTVSAGAVSTQRSWGGGRSREAEADPTSPPGLGWGDEQQEDDAGVGAAAERGNRNGWGQ